MNNKTQPLQPIRARNIGKSVPEPSGLTYCSSTKNFYVICDKPECRYIYEIDTDGNLVIILQSNNLFSKLISNSNKFY